jgi:hypothetical protein
MVPETLLYKLLVGSVDNVYFIDEVNELEGVAVNDTD